MAAGIAGLGLPLDHGATRISQIQELGHLVEGLPRRVVPRAPEWAIGAFGRDMIQVGVPPGDHQRHEGVREVWGVEARGGDMAFQVVHRHQRKRPAIGDGFGDRDPNQQRPDQPRPRRHGDRADIGQRHPGIRQGAVDDRSDDLDVPSRGQFRHDPAVRRVHLDLGSHHRAADDPTALENGGGGLIAGRFDAKDQMHRSRSAVRRFHGSTVRWNNGIVGPSYCRTARTAPLPHLPPSFPPSPRSSGRSFPGCASPSGSRWRAGAGCPSGGR